MSVRPDLLRQWRDLMRSWGFTVLEAGGWETRDAEPRTTYDPTRMFLEHHDASTVLSGNWGALAYVTANKLAQLVFSRDGQAMIVAAGVCWHAGVGGPFADIPRNAGNRYSLAVEVANSGREAYAPALTRLIIAAEAAWCLVTGRRPDRVRGHKEWATPAGRKTDPSVDMNQRRRDVAAFLANPQGDDMSSEQLNSIRDQIRGDISFIRDQIRGDLAGVIRPMIEQIHGETAVLRGTVDALAAAVAQTGGIDPVDLKAHISTEVDRAMETFRQRVAEGYEVRLEPKKPAV